MSYDSGRLAGQQLREPSHYQVRFEDTHVMMVVNRFKLHCYLHDLLDDCELQPSARRLTFESFQCLFPDFPILLSARYRGKMTEACTPALLFRKFDLLFLHDCYLEAYALGADKALGRPIGLVVPFGGSFDTRGVAMTYDVPNDQPPHRVTIEPFDTVLRYLARAGWSPRTPMSAQQPVQGPRVSRAMSVNAAMVKTLGPKSALILFAWFQGVLLSSSGYHRHYVRRINETECCVAATQEEIAMETGLSMRQVKSGLAELREQGLVSTQTKRGRSYIRVTQTDPTPLGT